MINLSDEFEERGGKFVSRSNLMRSNLAKVKVYLFDWDGVFNNGYRSRHGESDLSVAEAVGIDMLRFGHWIKFGELPMIIGISANSNPNAQYFAMRERFDAIVIDIDKKENILKWIDKNGYSPDEVMYVYEDVSGIPIAYKSGVRMFVKKNSTIVLEEYLVRHHLMDYATGSEGGNHAIRELSELCLMLMGKFDEVVSKKSLEAPAYKEYLAAKEKRVTHTLRWVDGIGFQEVED